MVYIYVCVCVCVYVVCVSFFLLQLSCSASRLTFLSLCFLSLCPHSFSTILGPVPGSLSAAFEQENNVSHPTDAKVAAMRDQAFAEATTQAHTLDFDIDSDIESELMSPEMTPHHTRAWDDIRRAYFEAARNGDAIEMAQVISKMTSPELFARIDDDTFEIPLNMRNAMNDFISNHQDESLPGMQDMDQEADARSIEQNESADDEEPPALKGGEVEFDNSGRYEYNKDSSQNVVDGQDIEAPVDAEEDEEFGPLSDIDAVEEFADSFTPLRDNAYTPEQLAKRGLEQIAGFDQQAELPRPLEDVTGRLSETMTRMMPEMGENDYLGVDDATDDVGMQEMVDQLMKQVQFINQFEDKQNRDALSKVLNPNPSQPLRLSNLQEESLDDVSAATRVVDEDESDDDAIAAEVAELNGPQFNLEKDPYGPLRHRFYSGDAELSEYLDTLDSNLERVVSDVASMGPNLNSKHLSNGVTHLDGAAGYKPWAHVDVRSNLKPELEDSTPILEAIPAGRMFNPGDLADVDENTASVMHRLRLQQLETAIRQQNMDKATEDAYERVEVPSIDTSSLQHVPADVLEEVREMEQLVHSSGKYTPKQKAEFIRNMQKMLNIDTTAWAEDNLPENFSLLRKNARLKGRDYASGFSQD
jgi:hypothetical protein